MRNVGTIVRGIRTPIIKEGDDLASIVVDSVLKASESEKFDFNDKDIIAVTEAVVGISEGNFATLAQIAKDIKNKLNSDHIGVVFPILSRNRFAVLLSAMARSTKKITILSSFPSDEVGNDILYKDDLIKYNKKYYGSAECGGTTAGSLDIYKYKYTSDKDNYYVYLSLSSGTLDKDGEPLCYIDYNRTLEVDCEKIGQNNYQNFSQYKYTFTKDDNGDYVFSKLEKIK